jgi:fatty-acyl-CoA synthase
VGWAPSIVVGASVALADRFSASGWLPDIRRYGVTYFNYTGKPLSYILAQPERPDDADNTLRVAFGNEGAPQVVEAFAQRFGVHVIDAFGATEGGLAINRDDESPPGAVGRAGPEVKIFGDDDRELPRARFDETGALIDPTECVGEIVNTAGVGVFEGYYNNDEANQAKTRDGIYWSGDLGYMDANRLVYFAGRDAEWLRVDGENFAAGPIERLVARFAPVVLAAVYGVPNEIVGDDVMVALQLVDGVEFDVDAFETFLAAQPDLGTKWVPRYVRVSAVLPVTPTNKVLKRSLKAERWDAAEAIWWRQGRKDGLRPMTDDDRAWLLAEFTSRDRLQSLI